MAFWIVFYNMDKAIHCIEQIKEKTSSIFRKKTGYPFFTFLQMDLHRFWFCPQWNEVLMLENPRHHLENKKIAEFSQQTFELLHGSYHTLWSEIYHYIPWASENIKYSSCSSVKIQLEMHINIHDGLTPNCEWALLQAEGSEDLAQLLAPKGTQAETCHRCTGIVLPVYLSCWFIFSPLAYLSNMPVSWEDPIMFPGLLAEQVFCRGS